MRSREVVGSARGPLRACRWQDWQVLRDSNRRNTCRHRHRHRGGFTSRSDGHTLYGTDHGRPGGRTYKDLAAARRAYDLAIAAKKAEGYKRVDRDETIVEVVADVHRDALLDAAIATATDASPFLVYADWLQERGDPRGEFIALQHTMQKQSDPVEFMRLKKQGQALLLAHERAWIGDVTVACGHRVKLDWKHGFIEAVRIGATDNPTEPALDSVLASILAAPCGCALRSIDLVGAPFQRSAELLAALALSDTRAPQGPWKRALLGSRACSAATDDHRARLEAAGVEVELSLV